MNYKKLQGQEKPKPTSVRIPPSVYKEFKESLTKPIQKGDAICSLVVFYNRATPEIQDALLDLSKHDLLIERVSRPTKNVLYEMFKTPQGREDLRDFFREINEFLSKDDDQKSE